jgi:photosystem II stability/assembly factor-like uncharacterized protein
VAAIAALAACLAAALFEPSGAPVSRPSAAAAAEAAKLPPVRHVWVIMFENSRWSCNLSATLKNCSPFQDPGFSPYLREVASKQGNVLSEYYGIGHNSLDNYLAFISGQAPGSGSQDDCDHVASTPEWDPSETTADQHGQVIGQGCRFPAKVNVGDAKDGSTAKVDVKTFANQLEDEGYTWKGYMESLGNNSAYDGFDRGCPYANRHAYSHTDPYVLKHDPFQWFHTITDNPACPQHDVPVTELAGDLQTVRTTPNFSFIAPNIVHDGHENSSVAPGFARTADTWLRQFLPMIMASPAYRQDGLILFTFDESDQFTGIPSSPEDNLSCCNEIPGPNSPSPGIVGPGGGHTGSLVLSPFTRPGTTTGDDSHKYNHYSSLRSFEDLFGIKGGDDGAGHLGFAGNYIDYLGPGSFDSQVYNGYDGSPGQPADDPSGGPTGPRRADGSTAFQYPLPQNNDLNGVSCASADHCVAVGDEGTIVESNDGGGHWATRASGTLAKLNGVSCPTAQLCVAVGSGGTILGSSDGGGSWHSGPAGPKTLNAVSCTGSTSCVAVGDGGTVLRSDAGAGNWTPQDSNTKEPLYGVSCPADTTCYAVGGRGTVLRTTDGSTWAAQTPSSAIESDGAAASDFVRLNSISCSSAKTCSVGADVEKVLRTTDGGATWSAGNTANPMRTYFGAACPADNACFFVGKTDPGWGEAAVAGGAVTGYNGSSYAGQAANTTNGLNGVSCPTSTMCLAVGMRGEIVRTEDGGATPWSPRSPGTDSELAKVVCETELVCAFEGMNSFNGMACTNVATCFAVGPYQTVMATTDKGATWSTQTTGAPPPAASSDKTKPPPTRPPALNAISCGGSQRCVAVGDIGDSSDSQRAGRGSVVATADGGSHWTDQVSGVKADLLGVSCPSPDDCFAVGSNGTIIHTTDGGAHWDSQDPGTGALLSSISCADTSTCVAVGNFGTILRTTDGGGHWSAGNSGTTAYLSSVSCPSRELCVAVGSGGTVVRIPGSGEQASERPTGVGDDLMAVSCSSDTHCVATGSSGTVISTATGGNDWDAQGTGTSRALRAIACASTDSCTAAGDAAAILGVTPTATPGRGEGGGGPAEAITKDSGIPCAAVAPRTSILRGGLRLTRRSIRISGRASVQDCVSNRLSRVQVALARAVRGGCRFLGRNGRLGRRRSCRRPIYLLARVRGSTWSLTKSARLPLGRYRILVRGRDSAGRLQPRALQRVISLRR